MLLILTKISSIMYIKIVFSSHCVFSHFSHYALQNSQTKRLTASKIDFEALDFSNEESKENYYNSNKFKKYCNYLAIFCSYMPYEIGNIVVDVIILRHA